LLFLLKSASSRIYSFPGLQVADYSFPSCSTEAARPLVPPRWSDSSEVLCKGKPLVLHCLRLSLGFSSSDRAGRVLGTLTPFHEYPVYRFFTSPTHYPVKIASSSLSLVQEAPYRILSCPYRGRTPLLRDWTSEGHPFRDFFF